MIKTWRKSIENWCLTGETSGRGQGPFLPLPSNLVADQISMSWFAFQISWLFRIFRDKGKNSADFSGQGYPGNFNQKSRYIRRSYLWFPRTAICFRPIQILAESVVTVKAIHSSNYKCFLGKIFLTICLMLNDIMFFFCYFISLLSLSSNNFNCNFEYSVIFVGGSKISSWWMVRFD